MTERTFQQLLIGLLLMAVLGTLGVLLWSSTTAKPPVSFNLQPKTKP
jgi:hypothetical protein